MIHYHTRGSPSAVIQLIHEMHEKKEEFGMREKDHRLGFFISECRHAYPYRTSPASWNSRAKACFNAVFFPFLGEWKRGMEG